MLPNAVRDVVQLQDTTERFVIGAVLTVDSPVCWNFML